MLIMYTCSRHVKMSPQPTSQKGKINSNEKFREQLYADLSSSVTTIATQEREIGVRKSKKMPLQRQKH